VSGAAIGIPMDLSPVGTCAAIAAARGYHVFPIHSPVSGACSCRRNCGKQAAKHPRTQRGLSDATTDMQQVATWWRTWPEANIAVACKPSGLFVVDTDGEEATDAWQLLLAEHDPVETTIVQTARGWHYWYAVPTDSTLGNTASVIAPGIDTRGPGHPSGGGYVFLPPTKHISGHVYRFETALPPAPLPPWVAELPGLVKPPPPEPGERTPIRVPTGSATPDRLSRYAYAALERELTAVLNAPVGERNETLNRAAFNLGTLVGAGLLPEQEVRNALYDAGRAAGLAHMEMVGAQGTAGTISSGLAKGMAQPRRVSA